MFNYKVCLNNGIEACGVDQKTITVNEMVETVDEQALAREIAHLNPLIPEQVAKAVLENFCKAAATLMSMGFAIQLKNGNDAALRLYPDIHVRGGNINLSRAQQLDPTVTELTVENAGALVDKAGVTVRAKAECEQKFTEMLMAESSGIQRKEIVEKARVERVDNEGGGSTGGGGETPVTPDPGTGGDNGGSNGGGGDNPNGDME